MKSNIRAFYFINYTPSYATYFCRLLNQRLHVDLGQERTTVQI